MTLSSIVRAPPLRELSLAAFGPLRPSTPRRLNQLTMGFEEIKKWKEEKAKQAALGDSDKKKNPQNTPYTAAPVSQPAYFPPCGLGVQPRAIRTTSGRTATPITLFLASQVSEAEDKNKVEVVTTLVFRTTSRELDARHAAAAAQTKDDELDARRS